MNGDRKDWQIRIKEMDLFTGLDLNVMGKIADIACTEETFPKGTVIFREGDSAKALFILYEGAVDLEIGRGKTVYRLNEPSDVFGWSSMVENAQYTATAVANTDIKAVKIDTRKINQVFNESPMVGLMVYRRLAAAFNKRLASIYARYQSVLK